MGDLILFPQKEKKNMKRGETMYENLVADLKKDNSTNQYTIKQAEELADRVLKTGGYFDIQAPPPIVNIAKGFDFLVLQQPILDENESGNIYIGGTTEEIYNRKQVIIAGDKEEYFHQRFIIAHELGHYLMDYLGDSEYIKNPGKLFSRAYWKGSHDDSIQELRADRFAAELLMPSHLFTAQYLFAMEESYDKRYVISYLSSFFKTKKSSIERRIKEIMNTIIS